MKKNQNLVTWKIKYSCEHNLFDYIDSYNKVLRFTYNRLRENPEMTTKELTEKQKLMKHLPECIGSHLLNSAIFDARAIISTNKKPVIFGGKLNFLKRCQHKLDLETFRRNRLVPIYSVGESAKHSNRLFRIMDGNRILFQPDRKHHYTLQLINVGRNRSKDIMTLQEFQRNCHIPITYKMDFDYIYMTFDYNCLYQSLYGVKQNRVIAIDMNPNHLGYSVVDWKNESQYQVIESGTFSLQKLNEYQNLLKVSSSDTRHKYVVNKRKHEVIYIANRLFEICKHYRCEMFVIEDLDFDKENKSKRNKKSKKFNKLVRNQWLRDLLVCQIRKRVNCSSTAFIEAAPQYSSFIGNLIYRQEKLPDEILASIEIGRRGFEFGTQYLFNRRPQQKTVIFPKVESVKNQLSISLAEIGVDVPELTNWISIYGVVKKSGMKYRFSMLEAKAFHSDSLFSKFYKHYYLDTYVFL